MDIKDLVGKTIKSINDNFSYDKLEITFEDGTLLVINERDNFIGGFDYEINPEENLDRYEPRMDDNYYWFVYDRIENKFTDIQSKDQRVIERYCFEMNCY